MGLVRWKEAEKKTELINIRLHFFSTEAGTMRDLLTQVDWNLLSGKFGLKDLCP